MTGPRARFSVFSMERWLAGAKDGWWTLFWIYNVAWAAACTILLIPLLPTIAGMLLMRDQQVLPCAPNRLRRPGRHVLLMIVGGHGPACGSIARSMNGLRTATAPVNRWAAGRSAIRADLGRHLLIFIAVFVVALAGASFFSSFHPSPPSATSSAAATAGSLLVRPDPPLRLAAQLVFSSS